MPDRMLDVLLIEDDEIDQKMVRRHLDDSNVRLHIARDVTMAIDLLRNRRDLTPDRQRWLILLDLNLPGAGGLEFLNYLRATPELAAIPVVVITTSMDTRDLRKAYQHHVSGYFIKPLEPMSFRRRLQAITRYWSESEMSA